MASPSRRPLAIFDVCDTLFSTNTTFAFLAFYAAARPAPRLSASLARWTSRRSPLFYVGAILYRLTGADVARTRAIAALKGERRDALNDSARRFADEILPGLANQPLLDRLTQHKSAGDDVLLASSSLDLVIAPIAERLNVDFVASTLGFDGDRCSGRLENDLTGAKLTALQSRGFSEDRAVHVYTDNRSDAALLDAATFPNIVLPHGRQRQRWGTDRCSYIEL